jgi:hypothetical protein
VTDDIVTRLRRWGDTVGSFGMMRALHYQAADEIERLRAAGDALATVMQSGSDAGWDAAIDAWQEARHG